jgi:asparagine synthase (glutamine-hydrolysing)
MGYALKNNDVWEEDLFRWLEGAADPLQRANCTDLATWLPDDLLVKFDRMAMANSLEGRAPYLDPKIVEIGVRNLAQEDKVSHGINKVALRRIGGRWLPKNILARPKQGFVLPMRDWIRQWFEAYGGASPYFSTRPLPIVDNGQVKQLVATDLQQGVCRERMLFAIILLAEWYAKFSESTGLLKTQYKTSGYR